MPIAVRTVKTLWEGPLGSGRGTLGESSSGVLDGQEVTWASRTEAPDGKTSPEELCAAAHSSCFSMAFSLKLAENGTPPERLVVQASVTFDEVDGAPTISSSKLEVDARVPGIDERAFQAIVADAGGFCPVSRLFAGAEITIEARLEES